MKSRMKPGAPCCPSCKLAADDLARDADCGAGPLSAVWIQSTSPTPLSGTSSLPSGAWIVYNLTPPSAAIKVQGWCIPEAFVVGEDFSFATARLLIGWLDEDNYLFADLISNTNSDISLLKSHLEIGKRVSGLETILATGLEFSRETSGAWRSQACLQQLGETWHLSMIGERLDDPSSVHTLQVDVITPPGDHGGLMSLRGQTDWEGLPCGSIGFQIDKIDASCPCSIVQSSSNVPFCCNLSRFPEGGSGFDTTPEKKVFHVSWTWSGNGTEDCCGPLEMLGWLAEDMGGLGFVVATESIGGVERPDAVAVPPICFYRNRDAPVFTRDIYNYLFRCHPFFDFRQVYDQDYGDDGFGVGYNNYLCGVFDGSPPFEILSCNPFHMIAYISMARCPDARIMFDCDGNIANDAVLTIEITE